MPLKGSGNHKRVSLKTWNVLFFNNLVFEPWGLFPNIWNIGTRADSNGFEDYLPTFLHLLTEPNNEYTFKQLKSWHRMIPNLQDVYSVQLHTKFCITNEKEN